LRIAIVAGEASGDLLGSILIRAVRERVPEAEFYGIAGPKMIAAGATTLYPMEKLSVRGYVEVLRRLPELLRIRSELGKRLASDRPALFIGVDAPDFNLGLEAKLKARGIPTVHYVSPSIWAWRPERIHTIGRSVDHMLCLFPFEKPLYDRAGIAATYVGHPLAEAMPLEAQKDDSRTQLRLGGTGPAVALLPGSRQGELEQHADLFIETAKRIAAARPGTRFLVPLATRETRDYFESRVYAHDAHDLQFTILFGHATLALQAADAALVASGTATLEAALARCPMVIAYRMPRLSYWLMRRKSLIPFAGLPNILSGEFIVPELLQEDATPDNLAQALGNWLDNATARERLQERYARIHAGLRVDSAERIGQAVLPFLDSRARGFAGGNDGDAELAPVRGR
jgi:lipid-A-disaccharide synthase